MSEAAALAPTPAAAPRHGLRIGVMWAVLTAIVVPLVIWVVGPHIPPGSMSQQSRDQHDTNVALTALAMPVLLLIWVYFGYALAVFRQDGAANADGPPITADPRIQATWLIVTGALVLGLAVFGTLDMLDTAGAGGGGQGPSPLVKPADAGSALQVQVIGQQWQWTFRYPGYGGVETATLELPVGREVELHVTSLDVAHSFYAVELAVKADAIPGSDNVAFVKAVRPGSFQVRCAELCGLWHGHMNSTGQIVSETAFSSWIASQRRLYAGVTKDLPPYSLVYTPQPTRNAG